MELLIPKDTKILVEDFQWINPFAHDNFIVMEPLIEFKKLFEENNNTIEFDFKPINNLNPSYKQVDVYEIIVADQYRFLIPAEMCIFHYLSKELIPAYKIAKNMPILVSAKGNIFVYMTVTDVKRYGNMKCLEIDARGCIARIENKSICLPYYIPDSSLVIRN